MEIRGNREDFEEEAPKGSRFTTDDEVEVDESEDEVAVVGHADESFCERINSAANQVVTKRTTPLSDDEVNMLVVLRMNRSSMSFMRLHRPEVSKQLFELAVLTAGENEESDNEDE